MFNCVAVSANKTFFAATSNTDIWTCSTANLAVISSVRRGSQGFYYDLPTTGITICNKSTRLVVGAADYTIAVLDITSRGTILAKNDTFSNKTRSKMSAFVHSEPILVVSAVVAAAAVFVPQAVFQQTFNVLSALWNQLLFQ
eukprot:Lankesteria_metandrocarpae@DN5120_c0_g1_i3.p2